MILERDNRGTLIGRLRVDVEDGVPTEPAVSDAAARRDPARKRREPLSPADRLQILVQYLIGRRLIPVLDDEIVDFRIRRVVPIVEHDGRRRRFAAMMTCPARNLLRAAEIRTVE